MTRELNVMAAIQTEKAKEMAAAAVQAAGQIPLNAEGKALAGEKRFTFDIIDTPADPLR